MVVTAKTSAQGTRRAIHVPVTAIRRAYGQAPYVMVVTAEDNKVVAREVELGPLSGDDVEILSGLSNGELLIVREQHLIVAGDRVRHRLFNAVPVAQNP
jgi:multidrug efflux pump subunit AcrA (membrane-fusion protein)